MSQDLQVLNHLQRLQPKKDFQEGRSQCELATEEAKSKVIKNIETLEGFNRWTVEKGMKEIQQNLAQELKSQ